VSNEVLNAEERPCGRIHPLPCGLDRECEVPVKYFDAGQSDETIWVRYRDSR